ncbi:MAG: diaminopropionate ammonia-lyase [Paracoccaceae bacterium]|jgi:diaminopropionate ammonia-lyase|nr:diaminopropionate ammonia-lyase [Paracoccaceae bacterium]MDP5368283.1 diaminopropionate ammonia-lyase [Paracoccaceae bacterium]
MHSAFSNTQIAHHVHNALGGSAKDQVITSQDFTDAIAEITTWQGYAPTPLYALRALAEELGIAKIHYKDEALRFNLASFKALGGAYAALRLLQKELTAQLGHPVKSQDIIGGRYRAQAAGITLVSATDGNHGRSLAWGCQRFGVPCRIYIHAEVSEGRAEAMRAYGALVVRIAGDYDASVALTRLEAEKNGWFVISDTSWPGYQDPPRDVMAGYGVMVNEICQTLDQAPTHVFLQGGVGGMAASITAFLRQYWSQSPIRICVVEPDLAPCLFVSAQNGTLTNFNIQKETVMAGLSCGAPSPLAWPILDAEVTDFLTIPDTVVGPTMRLLAHPLADDPAITAGESAVAGLAVAIAACHTPDLRDALALGADARILVFGSEGITDPDIYAQLMAEV